MRLTIAILLLIFSLSPSIAQDRNKAKTKITLNSGEVLTVVVEFEDSASVLYKKDGQPVWLNKSDIKEMVQLPAELLSGLKFVVARGGETIAQIAANNKLLAADVSKWNGWPEDLPLSKGQKVKLFASAPSLHLDEETDFVVPTQPCLLKIQGAPQIRGFKLGMKLRPVNKNADTGVSEISLPGRVLEEQGKGVSMIELTLLDDELAKFTVYYDSSTEWKSSRDFAFKVAETLSLPDAWLPVSRNSREQILDCDGFTLKASLEISNPSITVERKDLESVVGRTSQD